jgi:hypothetical protein
MAPCAGDRRHPRRQRVRRGLVGERVGDELHYRGTVEWCFTAPDVLALLEHARRWSPPLSPFLDLRRARSVTWLKPRLAEVSYAEIVEGRLRAPSWRAPSPRESR